MQKKRETFVHLSKINYFCIVTLVDKYSSMLLMRKLDTGKKAAPLAQVVIELVRDAKIKVRSITTDNGTEFAEHETISKGLGCNVY